ncbi:MAG TPA: hypothetical protein VIJ94_13025 [Caulobacteraceae bacterium]
MQVFDPDQVRAQLDGITGYRWFLQRSFNETAKEQVLGNWASSYLELAVECLLVGYVDAADQILNRARDWLQIAIKSNERPHDYASGSTEARRSLDLALCNWLLFDQHDAEDYGLFLQGYDGVLESRGWSRNRIEVSLILPRYVDAGAYSLALARYAGAGMQPPASLDRVVTEGQMCYVLCRFYLGQEYSADDVAKALKRFLNRAVNHWLLEGDFVRAAEWMKIVHWNGHQGELSAKDAVLKCYDYLKTPIPIGPDLIP